MVSCVCPDVAVPSWAQMTNRSLIRGAVVVYAEGLDPSFFASEGPYLDGIFQEKIQTIMLAKSKTQLRDPFGDLTVYPLTKSAQRDKEDGKMKRARTCKSIRH
jgi:hypothetical protein